MKVITIYQPWATWIMLGWKTIETRWHNRFAGLKGETILIHAGQQFDDEAYKVAKKYFTHKQLEGYINQQFKGYPRGALLGTALVYDHRVLSYEHSKAALITCDKNRFGLFLKDIRPFEVPIPAKGHQGIWEFDLHSYTKEQVRIWASNTGRIGAQ